MGLEKDGRWLVGVAPVLLSQSVVFGLKAKGMVDVALGRSGSQLR